LSICVLVAWSSLLVLNMIDDMDGAGPWHHHYYLRAMPTPASVAWVLTWLVTL
jgi:hypothetical protein